MLKLLSREEAAAEVDREEREEREKERELKIARKLARAEARATQERARREKQEQRQRELDERCAAAMKRAEKLYGKDVARQIKPADEYELFNLTPTGRPGTGKRGLAGVQMAVTWRREHADTVIPRATKIAGEAGFHCKRIERVRGVEIPDKAPRLVAVDPDPETLRRIAGRGAGN